MDKLRLILLVLGVLFIAGVYAWEIVRRRQSRTRRPHRHSQGNSQGRQQDGLAVSAPATPDDSNRQRDDEPLSDDLLTGLGDVVPGRDEAVGEFSNLSGSDPSGSGGSPPPVSKPSSASASRREPEPAPPPPGAKRPVQKAEEQSGPVVAITVMARNGDRFSGAKLAEALENVGMASGEAKIYHRYPGSQPDKAPPLFSAANVVKPGTLGRDELPSLLTPGVALFMQCGGGEDDHAAFELMLNTGRQLAAELDGEVCDQRRTVLTPESIGSLRRTVTESRV